MTRIFREGLGVREVPDRRDIFEKYNQLIENEARKPGAFSRGDKHGEREQYEADQVGIYAMARAGYDPQSFASFWDRLAETGGKTGGWFSTSSARQTEARRCVKPPKPLGASKDFFAPRASTAPASAEGAGGGRHYTGPGRKRRSRVPSRSNSNAPARESRGPVSAPTQVLRADDAGVNV